MIKPRLGFYDLAMLIISMVIGIGIFRTPQIVAQKSGTVELYFAAWIIGAVISICGALTFAEIGARYPVAGGFYKVFSFCYHPAFAFMLNWSLVIINRPVSLFKINRIEIAKCSIVSKKEMSGTIRTFGNGGLFGYTGYYRNAKFGTMRWFATQRKNYVLIEKINGKKIIITPDEPENFIAALG